MTSPSDDELAAGLVAAGLLDNPADAFVRGFEFPRIRAIYRAIAEHAPAGDAPILDVGYLDGRVPLILQKLDESLRIVSTERDVETAASAAQRAREAGRPVEILPLDLTDTAPLDDAFRAIVLGEVLEHIPAHEVQGILRRLREALVPGGIIVVTTPNLHGLAYRIRHLLGVDFVHDPIPNEVMGLPHVNLYSARVLTDLASSVGLSPVRAEFHSFTGSMRAHLSRRGRLLHVAREATLSRWAPTTRDDLVVALRRVEGDVSPSAVFGSTAASVRQGLKAARQVPTVLSDR